MNENTFFAILFSIIPITTLIFCFLKDIDENRRKKTNSLLVINCAIFLAPLMFAYLFTRPNGNMWNENGAGAVLWFYLLLLPACFVAQLILVILKIKYSLKKENI